ncbi:hypothetical protein PsorP6_019098 [Peronosclerospora sorghi]|nr:hypothetical protein PsorP6_019098 [Peronosclerospora sorghi]
MLLSSMDQLSYYSMAKENTFLELDSSANVPAGHDGYSLPPEEIGVVSYMNEENSPKNGTKSSLYKTELCKRFSEFGNCRYGAKCQFAHGIAELRHVVRHPKYKTTKCKSYWGSGHCPYGSRCRFIHEETEGYPQPQYSPSHHLGGGMFLHEKDRLSGLNAMTPPALSTDVSYGGSFYGEQPSLHHHQQLHSHHHQMLPSYIKESRLFLSSPDKSLSWGVPDMSRSANLYPDYTGDRYSNTALRQQESLGSVGLPTSQQRVALVNNAVNGVSSPSYPDLQDAIDALMKFSLTQDEVESTTDATTSDNTRTQVAGGHRVSSVSSPALVSSATSTRPEFSLQSDELWKEFSTPSSTPFKGEELQTQPWSTGLSLNLDSKPFDNGAVDASDSKKVSGSGDVESPRLSVFERFH